MNRFFKDNMLKAITVYSGKPLIGFEFIPDPQVAGTYAVKTFHPSKDKREKSRYWIFVGVRENMCVEQLENHLEEAEFTTWPPTGGKTNCLEMTLQGVI